MSKVVLLIQRPGFPEVATVLNSSLAAAKIISVVCIDNRNTARIVPLVSRVDALLGVYQPDGA